MCHPCPCCAYITLDEVAGWEICPVCFWEDDGHSDDTAGEPSGPNDGLSLTAARDNFAKVGVCDVRFLSNVRAPRPDEIPD